MPDVPMQEIHGTVVSVPTGDHLNVRSKPDAASDVMAQIDDGASVTVLGEELHKQDNGAETKWLLVTVGASSGWVNSKYIKITEASCK